ncbi:MAG: argininosuccinate lyase [Candidatus Nanohaloarchaea archaeon]|jgi:argininosuccinate lyase
MLWETAEDSTNSKTMQFTTEQEGIEQKMLPYDILGNLAHVKMLKQQEYMTQEELEIVEKELKQLYDYNGKIEAEDVHTFVEEKVTEKTDAGKKIHTGRSRNDQVFLDTRLLMKDSSIHIAEKTLELIKTIEGFAEEKNQLMPGYTHQQQAMPSSTGLWASSFADALVDDLKLLKGSYQIFDQNPLGAAASYGTSLDIDREKTKDLLGFNSVQENPIYCGSRGKHELMLVQALNHMMMDLQKMAEDIINFSEDQQVFELPDEFCTGSSIMPQKKNPDTLEMVRAKAEELNASTQAIHGVISKLPSGYNKDSQQTKKHLVKSIETVIETLEITTALISELEISDNFEIKDEVYAAYTANQEVERDIPFRDAYMQVKKSEEYEKSTKIKEPKMQSCSEIESYWEAQKQRFNTAKENLLQ